MNPLQLDILKSILKDAYDHLFEIQSTPIGKRISNYLKTSSVLATPSQDKVCFPYNWCEFTSVALGNILSRECELNERLSLVTFTKESGGQNYHFALILDEYYIDLTVGQFEAIDPLYCELEHPFQAQWEYESKSFAGRKRKRFPFEKLVLELEFELKDTLGKEKPWIFQAFKNPELIEILL